MLSTERLAAECGRIDVGDRPVMAIAFTQSAARTLKSEQYVLDTVSTWAGLERLGSTRSQVRARIAARRWQQFGRAVVLHHGELSRNERQQVVLANSPGSTVLASLTALERLRLQGWERDEIHILIPARGRAPRRLPFPVVVHRCLAIEPAEVLAAQRTQRAAPAIVLATTTMPSLRSACGLLAAGVQQRLATARDLQEAIEHRPTMRNRRPLLLAVKDIAMGAEALSEIDFARLCRRAGLPEPVRQAVRIEPDGRRRYLDAQFRRRDGTPVGVEVDGAIHLSPTRWFGDQFRQNEIVLGGMPLLRFPAFSVREQDPRVIDQLTRFLAWPNDLASAMATEMSTA